MMSLLTNAQYRLSSERYITKKMTSSFMRLCCVVFASAVCLFARGATTYITNSWIGASGGDWGTDENWSLGHVPKDNEMAYFDFSGKSLEILVNDEYTVGTWYVTKASMSAPLTFKGTGKILHNGYGPSPYIYNNHPITLDGVTLDAGNMESLWYSPMTITNGGAYITKNNVYLWTSAATFTINGGTYRGGRLSWGANTSITITDGDVSCTKFNMRDSADNDGNKKYYSVNISINEGSSFSCSSEFNLYRNSSLSMNGGAFTTEGTFNVEPEVVLNLNSGAITNKAALTDKRFITQNKGVTMCIKDSSNNAVFFDDVVDGDVLTFNAPFYVPNGSFSTTNTLTLRSDYPFQVARLYHLPDSTSKARITTKLSQLILGKYSVFNSGEGDARTFKIEGPTVWRPTVESMVPDTSRTVYPHLDGELIVDTRDWNDPSLARRVVIRNLGSDNGNGAIIVRGGGTFYMTHLYSYNSYRYVKVEEGSTLELGPYENSEYSTLNAMKFVLGANSTLKIPAGTNCVAAMSCDIDPTAKIIVDIPANMPAGGIPVVRDYSGRLVDCSHQVEFTGEGAEGWSTYFKDGCLAAVKKVNKVDGKYPFEWTGGAGTAKWSDTNNWYGCAVPEKVKDTVCVFGDADTILDTNFDMSGGYVGQIIFRNTAVKSFSVSSAGERTFFINEDNDSVQSCVYSESAVPQYLKLRFRKTGAGSIFSYTSKSGPVIIDTSISYPAQGCVLTACGDIRVAGSISWPQVNIYYMNGLYSPHSHLMVMPEGHMTVTNQTKYFGSGSTSFYVHKGGVLEFQDGGTGFYRWSVVPAKHVIDGLMSVKVPFMGGKNQAYGGEGTLAIARNEPYEAKSSLIMQDSITLDLSSDWLTVAEGADYPYSLEAASFSTPTLKLNGDWKYGPEVDMSSQTDASSRALTIGRSATLTVDAGGYSAIFADPVVGDGTLSITNGTLKLQGEVGDGVTVKLMDAGALMIDGDMSIGKLEAAGGALKYKVGSVLECSQIDDTSKLEFDFEGGTPGSWTTVLVSSSPINAEIANGGLETRVLTSSEGYILQCRKDIGFHFIVR